MSLWASPTNPEKHSPQSHKDAETTISKGQQCIGLNPLHHSTFENSRKNPVISSVSLRQNKQLSPCQRTITLTNFTR